MAKRPTDWQEVFGFSDPTPGDPWEVRQVEKTWRQVHEHAASAETTLRGLLGDDAVATWIGKAGDTFRTKSSDLPGQLGKVSESYRLAADAMGWWADRLDTHQGDADYQLARGREALDDLKAAQAKLDLAGHDVDGALKAPGMTALAPTPEQVQHAQDQLKAAQSAQSAAQGLVDNAQARLDAARALAADAGEARRTDGKETASKIRAAADAGVPPRSRWEKIKDGLADAWDFIVDVAKIVVAVLGVVVLIIGGPLAWIVLAAALIVLIDTVVKYAKGQASLLDVALAALGCIPGFKGLTTLKALTAAFKSGGVIGAVAHVGSAIKVAAVSIAKTVSVLKQGFIPGLKASVQILGADGALAFPQLKTTLMDVAKAFTSVDNQIAGMAADARAWQGADAFPGIDDYRNAVQMPGNNLEAGFPGLSNYAAPSGNAAAHGHSAPEVWEGLQVGPNLHDYRASVIEIQVNNPVDVATGTTMANPQYGAGGTQQFFLDIKGGLSSGDLSVLDTHGNPIDLTGIDPGDINAALNDLDAAGDLGKINLTDADNPGPGIAYQDEVRHHPDRFNAPDLGQINIDVDLQNTLDSIRQVLQGTGYYGGQR